MGEVSGEFLLLVLLNKVVGHLPCVEQLEKVPDLLCRQRLAGQQFDCSAVCLEHLFGLF